MARRTGVVYEGSGTDAAQRAGITPRQLEHWLRAGLIVPIRHDTAHPGSGRHRQFTDRDIMALRVLRGIMAVRDPNRDEVTERIREIVRAVQAPREIVRTGEYPDVELEYADVELVPGIYVDLERLAGEPVLS